MPGNVGRPMPRLEDDRLLRGNGMYLDDIHLSGSLHAHVVRSMHANARIAGIDVEGARRAPGVRLVLTGHDLGDLNGPLPLLGPHPSLLAPRTQRPLAVDRVRYVGEAIVMIVAEDRYLAEDAADLVQIDYEPLPEVVEFDDARRGDRFVHDDIADNVAAVVSQVRGDPEGVIRSAPHTLALSLDIERSCGSPLEGRGVLADWDPRRQKLTVFDSTQSPVAIRQGLSRILDVPLDRLEVSAPDVGGGFGTKIMLFYPEEVLVPYAALRLSRPVKWTEDRWEHFISANQERGQHHEAVVAFEDNGRILAVSTDFDHDTGAYVPYGIAVPAVTGTHLPGQYDIEHYRYSGRVLYTNKPPVSPYRGAGRPQGVFVMERLIGAVAKRLGTEPWRVRRANLIPSSAFPYDTGLELHDRSRAIYDSGSYVEGFDRMLSHVDVEAFRERQRAARAEGRHLGLGMATYVEGTGVGPYEGCAATLNSSGRIVLEVSVPSQGQGHATTFAQIAADVIGCAAEQVHVVTAAGGPTAVGHGTFGSRAAVMSGNAVAAAAHALRAKILAAASMLLECSAEDLETRDGNVFVRGAENARVSLADIASGANPIQYPGTDRPTPWVSREPGSDAPVSLSATEYFRSGQWVFGSGAHGVMVEVDPGTGRVTIDQYVVVHDCGRVINPLVVDGQVVGGLIQGIGGALLERLTFADNGQPTTTSFLNFHLPTVDDLPPLVLDHLETPSPWNPLGIKGTGEAGIIPVAAAIAEAIEDALSPFEVPVTSMPLFPAEIRTAIDRTEP
ncbi:xanthine dehydrogenase family protein molybdopterin-binding subunit [Acrocarpospora sp. B8E8]|uniref:xanthine dehydrogenase family protein molybdopterin-binding subunit n=1 Tax=Acrocarpospora sp. B8E8 TaxID=3153572 RepID=UPI00325CA505